DPGYPVWCDRCEWNLLAYERAQPTTRYQRLYLKVSGRMAQRLLTQIVRSGPTPPMLTFPKLLALVIAGLVHIFVLFVPVSGSLLIYASFHTGVFFAVMGFFLVVLGFLMRPRISRIPERNVVAR